MAQAQTTPVHGDGVTGDHAHPGERTYINVAIILAIITVAEVAIYYLESFAGILVPALMILSAIKFVTVVGYFMHLKFDDRRLRWIFMGGMSVALAVFIGMFALQHFHQVVSFFGDMI